MMTRAAPRHLLLFVSVALWAGALAPQLRAQSGDEGRQAQALSSAESAVERTREQLRASQAAVESLVTELEDDYTSLTSGPEAAGLRNALALAMFDALEPARARIAKSAADGRSLLRASRTKVLQEVFREPVRSSAGRNPRLADWIAGQVAYSLAARNTLDVELLDVQRLLDKLFIPGESWYHFWNRAFHQGLPEAAAYGVALGAYEDAGLELDRLRRPERYGPKGELAPAGMLVVAGGVYTLGPNAGWVRSRRKVTLKPFAMDRREVTVREYAAFIDSLPPNQQPALLPRGWSLTGTGRAVFNDAFRQHPVNHVSWNQAAAYAAWAGKRLPTEDEWEAAAAGPEGFAYPWGNAWESGKANGDGETRGTLPVESFPTARSPSGCFDMAGNAWEWTSTLEDGTDFDVLPDGLVNVVIRGGGWSSKREELATRHRWTAPGQAAFESTSYDRPIGFRCAKDL
jgi:formylglycine-generating enzyme required for sulfatase activity